jgi:hypothetical protein
MRSPSASARNAAGGKRFDQSTSGSRARGKCAIRRLGRELEDLQPAEPRQPQAPIGAVVEQMDVAFNSGNGIHLSAEYVVGITGERGNNTTVMC